MRPELLVSWASESAGFINNLKLKKSLKVFPVRVTGTAAWNLHTKAFTYKCTCKDMLLNGKITCDPMAPGGPLFEYRKRFALPMIGSRFGCLVASGRWAFNELDQSWHPAFRVGFEFRQGGAEIVQLNAVKFKPKLFLGNIGLVAHTKLTFQLPSKLLFDMAPYGPGERSGRVQDPDDDALGLNLDVQQLNLVIRL